MIIEVISKKHGTHYVTVDDYIYKKLELNKFTIGVEYNKSKKYFYSYIMYGNSKIRLHRFITNCPKGMVVDHINGDTLDNRIRNLKITTQSENSKNRQDSMHYGITTRNKTGYRGLFIIYDKRDKRYFYRFKLKGYKTRNFAISKKQDAIMYALKPTKMEHKEEFDKELFK